MNRREFLVAAGAVGMAHAGRTVLGADSPVAASRPALPDARGTKLPRWRGFNLLSKFDARRSQAYPEAEFAMTAEWGFDFVRLPMSYRCWAAPDDWLNLREAPLKEIDQAVEFGRQYHVHVNLNLHRAPGYCVNDPPEPADLWPDEKALEACAFHWAHLAKRYKGIPNSQVSFDLLNEPKDIKEEVYVRIVTRLVDAIHAEDASRLIIADGLKWGTAPVEGLVELGVAQSTRGYQPMPLTHYQARWIQGSERWPEPTWPLEQVRKRDDGTERREVWDKERLRRECIEPWRQLQQKGVGVHVGEFGCFSGTPHKTVMAWMSDQLSMWREAGWGWALWNLTGPFGILDSERKDIAYENHKGHKLDRKLLELLRES